MFKKSLDRQPKSRYTILEHVLKFQSVREEHVSREDAGRMNTWNAPLPQSDWKHSAWGLPDLSIGRRPGWNPQQSPGAETKTDGTASELAREVLQCLFQHRRLLPEAGACADTPCSLCLAPHLSKVRRAIERREPIHLVLPAFPAKSPSRRKTFGPLPDKAEELALESLQSLCNAIQLLYAPGARLTLCSDGRVFSDLVGVTEEDVTRYGQEIRTMIRRLGLRSLDTFHLEDRFTGDTFQEMRDLMETQYAEPYAQFAARVQKDNPILLNGIERFLLEERSPDAPALSKTQARKEARTRAIEVVRRSEAWGRLIAERFPSALRLSIHPQMPHSPKIGLRMGEQGKDLWITPWHGVAVQEAGGWTLRKREEAEALGAQLVEREGRPYYYTLEVGR
uniref:Isonitrile synthase n=1 Tax=uncultured organism TaxID=155900 RepID=Q108L3_9ZZZZ|nr:isonitrile synthase [uncultured organism]